MTFFISKGPMGKSMMCKSLSIPKGEIEICYK